MKSTISILICACVGAACGGADHNPKEPASSYHATASERGNTVASATPKPTPAAEARERWAAPASVARRDGADTAADNTKVNERDRGSSTLTPTDQGNSSSETDISAAIRRGIMDDKDLSFTAKNVKVITVGTKVTLRGPVTSKREKAAIGALAKRTAAVTEVDNQLEVKN